MSLWEMNKILGTPQPSDEYHHLELRGIELQKSGKSNPCVYNRILCIFMISRKYLSARISEMRWSMKLIFQQSIVPMGTSDPEIMSLLRHL